MADGVERWDVNDPRRNASEGVGAAINIIIRFPELEENDQHGEEAVWFLGAHRFTRGNQVVHFRPELILLRSFLQSSTSLSAPCFSKTSTARKASDFARSNLHC